MGLNEEPEEIDWGWKLYELFGDLIDISYLYNSDFWDAKGARVAEIVREATEKANDQSV